MQAHSRATLPTRQLVLAAMFAAVTSVLAYVRIPLPMSPVPITGQTFGMMLAGLLLGPRLGALSQAVYLLMGVAGLPVFAGGTAGLGVLVGPTGGYLWGHVAGAYVAGLVAGPDPGVPAGGGPLPGRPGTGKMFGRSLVGAVLGGIVVVYSLGVVQLAMVTGMSWEAALMAGAVPFVPGDLLKAVAAAAVAVRLAPVVSMAPVRAEPASR
ncbi:MAG TPA: biotin transporter BioY [Limnochordales bacterium]